MANFLAWQAFFNLRKSRIDSSDKPGEDTVCETGSGILFCDGARTTRQGSSENNGPRNITAHPKHHVRFDPPNKAEALPDCLRHG